MSNGMVPDLVRLDEVVEAVGAFNARYGEMERALWCLSRAARQSLLRAERCDVVEQLVWTIKSWWGIQGVRTRIKTLAGESLLALEWDSDLFKDDETGMADGEVFAVERVRTFVDDLTARGASRREWSLASKALHWLMPWRIPVYDGFVKKSLRISSNGDPNAAYQTIVGSEFEVARRFLKEERDWFGEIEPQSPFRALDKYFWWRGGGNNDRSSVVNDPWRIPRMLGLDES